MAFVFKSKRWDNISQQNEGGPGQYLGQNEIQMRKNFAPFNSTEEKQAAQVKDNQKKLKATPGPGSYNISKEAQTEKVLVSTVNQDIKIIEVPKESSIFKSVVKRMENRVPDIPGPGTYAEEYDVKLKLKQQQIKQRMSQQLNKSQQSSQNIIEQIMKVNKYQSIPSIPNKKQEFGYSENEQNELELNKNPVVVHSGDFKNSVGPGQYQQTDFIKMNKNKGTHWSKFTMKKLPKTTISHSIGPGQYDQSLDIKPLYKYKPSPGFISNTVRVFDQRKGAIANQHIMQKVKSQAKFLASEQDKQEVIEAIDDEFEYIEDTVPGPGHYNPKISSLKVGYKPEKLQFFGSSSLRFQQRLMASSGIGPGEYYKPKSQPSNQQLQALNSNIIIPFMSQKVRFEPQQLSEIPGPGQYNSKYNLEDRLIKKLQMGYKGQFGTSEKRFKPDEEAEENPGPGQYITQNTNGISNQPTYFIKGNQKSHFFVLPKNPKQVSRASFIKKNFNFKKENPPVGSYDINYFDLGKAQQREEELDPEYHVQIEGMGFMSSQPRFIEKKTPKIDEQLMEEQEDNLKQQESLNELFKLKKRQIEGLAFNSKEQRFISSQKNQIKPGPGAYYDPLKNPWFKRTYNIEFTGIK